MLALDPLGGWESIPRDVVQWRLCWTTCSGNTPLRLLRRTAAYASCDGRSCRPLGTHDGLQLPDARVIDITNDKGVQVRSYGDFGQGLEVTVVREVDPRLHGQVMANVRNAIANPPPYRLADSNCEVFVNALVCEKPESPSVKGWLILALVAGGLAFLAARA